jgi:hypothetical protein
VAALQAPSAQSASGSVNHGRRGDRFYLHPLTDCTRGQAALQNRCKTDRQHNFQFHTTCCQDYMFRLVSFKTSSGQADLIHDLYLNPLSPVVTIRTISFKNQKFYVQPT